jgi:hypothetical protein
LFTASQGMPRGRNPPPPRRRRSAPKRRAGATIVGDIKTAGIVIEDGAYFKGGIDISRTEPVKPAAKPAAPSSQASAAGKG